MPRSEDPTVGLYLGSYGGPGGGGAVSYEPGTPVGPSQEGAQVAVQDGQAVGFPYGPYPYLINISGILVRI